MSIENNIETFLKHEKELLFIKKKAEIGFWDYQILGLFSFLLNRKNDYLIITDKRVMYGLKDEIIKNIKHEGFNNIKFKTQNREFKSVTGFYKSKRITVVSTGIGSSNIDIVLNELDALVNLNLETGEVLSSRKSLNLIRIGTSGAIQNDVPVDSFLLSKMAIDIDGFMLNYDLSNIDNKSFTKYIYENHQIQDQLYCFNCSSDLYDKFNSTYYSFIVF